MRTIKNFCECICRLFFLHITILCHLPPTPPRNGGLTYFASIHPFYQLKFGMWGADSHHMPHPMGSVHGSGAEIYKTTTNIIYPHEIVWLDSSVYILIGINGIFSNIFLQYSKYKFKGTVSQKVTGVKSGINR